MYWLAPENFLFVLSVLLIVVGAVIGNSLVILAGIGLLVGLIVFSVVGMALRRNRNKQKDNKK